MTNKHKLFLKELRQAFVDSNNRKARLVIHRWPKGIKKCSSKKWFDETNNLLTLLFIYSDYEIYNLMCLKWFDLPEF